MTDQARVEYSSWRKAYSNAGGAAQSQADIGERERRATTTSEFAPTMIPGLLQTAGYAREVLALPTGPAAHGATPEAMAAERIKRQDILYQQGRSARFVLGEAALRTRFGSVDTLVAQLDRLVALAGLVTVDLAVVPFASALPVYPLGMFKLYDTQMAIAESLQGEHLLFDPEQITAYEAAFTQLHDAALCGADAVSLIQRVAADIRQY